MRATTMLIGMLMLAGCWPPRKTTDRDQLGKRATLELSWPGRRIAADADVPVLVRKADHSTTYVARVESSDPTVAKVAPLEYAWNVLYVKTGGPGTAELSFYDAHDALLDSFDLEVTAAAQVTYRIATGVIHQGYTTHIIATPYSADGEPLSGFWSVRAEPVGAVEVFAEEYDQLPDRDIALRLSKHVATVALIARGARTDLDLTAVESDPLF
jgi:hypothetical protein